MVPGATSADAAAASNELLIAAGLKATCVTVSPQLIEETTPLITVLVEIPVSRNFWISPTLFKNHIVRSEVTLFCERPFVVKLTGVPALKAKATPPENNEDGDDDD